MQFVRSLDAVPVKMRKITEREQTWPWEEIWLARALYFILQAIKMKTTIRNSKKDRRHKVYKVCNNSHRLSKTDLHLEGCVWSKRTIRTRMPVMRQPKAPSFNFKRNCSLHHIDVTCLKTLKTMHLVPMQLAGLAHHNRNSTKRKQMCELSLSHRSKMQARHSTQAKQTIKRLLKLVKNKMVSKCLPHTRSWISLPSSRSLPKEASRLTIPTKLTRMRTSLTHTLWAWSTAIFSQSVMATDQMVAMWVLFWSTDFHFLSKAIFSINLLSTIWCITLH